MEKYENFDLTHYNAYKTKSCCKLAFFPKTEGELIEVYNNYSDKEIIVIGNGNNIILSKEWYSEIFIILNGCFEKISVNQNMIDAEAGATILRVSEIALESGLTGAEFLYDIPSSVGGAVVMNAGTKEGETKNILHKVRYLDLADMLIKEKRNHEMEFEYRNSFFQKYENKIILKSWFKLKKGDPNSIEELMRSSKERRWKRQPREFPNCGSVFKRPPGRFVGPMIDELGLKGFKIGDAQISEKHSGFIINTGNAKGEDILSLIDYIRQQVYKKFGVKLEVEQRVI